MRTWSVFLAVVSAIALGVPAAAQTQEVGSQCGCDLQAGRIIRHPANQDCRSYCCSTYGGKWCGTGAVGTAPNSAGGALIQTFGNVLGAWMAHKDQKKREREALEAQRAAELQRELEEQRLREQRQRAQFDREKQSALAQMKGPRPDLIGMKDIGPSAAQVARQRELRSTIAAKLRLLNEMLGEVGRAQPGAGERALADGADPPRAEPPPFTQFFRPEQGDPVEIGIKGLEEAGLRDFQLRAASERRQSPDRIVDPYERALLRNPEYLEATQELTRAEAALDDALRKRVASEDVDGAILSLAMAQERLADVRARIKARR